MAFLFSSLIILAIWIFGAYQLKIASSNAISVNESTSAIIDNYDDSSLLNLSEAFISCRKDFERTPQYKSFDEFRSDSTSLNEEQKESIKRSIYICFSSFRPYLSCFNGRFNETEQFCYICSLLHLDNKHCGQLLNMSESSVRSCKTRLKSKLGKEPIRMLYDSEL